MAKEITIQQRVMEAGFGDMLLEYGFTKVSATQYKLDERLGTWRVALGKGYPNDQEFGPESFRDGAGFSIKGLNAFVEAFVAWHGQEQHYVKFYGGEYNLPGTRIKVHLSRDVPGEMLRLENFSDYPEPPPPPRTGIMAWLLGKERPEPPKHKKKDFIERHPDLLRGMRRKHAWLLRQERSIEEFTEEFCGYWADSIAKVIFQDRYEGRYLDRYESMMLENPNFSIRRACRLWLGGRQDVVRGKFEKTKAKFDISHADLLAKLEASIYERKPIAELPKWEQEKRLHYKASRLLRYQADAAAFMTFAERWTMGH